MSTPITLNVTPSQPIFPGELTTFTGKKQNSFEESMSKRRQRWSFRTEDEHALIQYFSFVHVDKLNNVYLRIDFKTHNRDEVVDYFVKKTKVFLHLIPCKCTKDEDPIFTATLEEDAERIYRVVKDILTMHEFAEPALSLMGEVLTTLRGLRVRSEEGEKSAQEDPPLEKRLTEIHNFTKRQSTDGIRLDSQPEPIFEKLLTDLTLVSLSPEIRRPSTPFRPLTPPTIPSSGPVSQPVVRTLPDVNCGCVIL